MHYCVCVCVSILNTVYSMFASYDVCVFEIVRVVCVCACVRVCVCVCVRHLSEF